MLLGKSIDFVAISNMISYRFKTIRRRTKYQLTKLSSRDHLVVGLRRAMNSIDKIIDIIKSNADIASARAALMALDQGFSLEQVSSFRWLIAAKNHLYPIAYLPDLG
jgi:DNA gyrase subunit A